MTMYQAVYTYPHLLDIESLVFNENGSLIVSDFNDSLSPKQWSPPSAEFLIFDSGKLALIDEDENQIIKQFDFEKADCVPNATTTFGELQIKYFYYMKPLKPEDILWNGEALISTNCDYKLALLNGSLVILNGSNDAIWTANATASGERNLVLYSYSSGNDRVIRVWDTDTSTLLQSSIVYADRAILNTKGQFFIIDNATLQEHYKVLPTNQSFDNEIRTARDTNMDCLSTRYDYVDKRNGFYASWVSYYNCGDNMYNKSTTTPCIAYVYCE
eukprot:737581_1